MEKFWAFWIVNYSDVQQPENYLLNILNMPKEKSTELLDEAIREYLNKKIN